jgi:hypothetical protein
MYLAKIDSGGVSKFCPPSPFPICVYNPEIVFRELLEFVQKFSSY